jgi:hypothetical protein
LVMSVPLLLKCAALEWLRIGSRGWLGGSGSVRSSAVALIWCGLASMVGMPCQWVPSVRVSPFISRDSGPTTAPRSMWES